MSQLIPILIGDTGLSELDLRSILHNAPSRYKRFTIKKRNGGDRKIAQPARELKALQRALMRAVLASLPVHETAKAYREGVSIRDNAAAHAGDGPILKYDFRDFFGSIKSIDWKKYCDYHEILLNEEDRWVSERILFYRERGSSVLQLSIGAPSSPIVSNILMFEFDKIMSNALSNDKVVYTRYADDITFSAPRTGYLNAVDRTLRRTLQEISWPRLEINESKTVLATSKYRREVTGLILPNGGGVSVGRDRKRELRAALHHAQQGKLSSVQLSQLCGMLAFVHAVEPDFLIRLELRYGAELMNHIKLFANVSRRDGR